MFFLRDLFFSVLIIILLFPFLIIIYLLVSVIFKENPIFMQKRIGYRCKSFLLFKFKTMKTIFDKSGNLLPDEDRLVKLGGFLRRLSIDELPQLINIITGDMSLVGPRPLLPEYVPLYSEDQKRRHEVKPGITGWAQVNGRNAISWEEKFDLDVWYVDNKSFWLDIKILWLTMLKVFKSEGISSKTSVTMEKFKGSKS